MLAVRLLIFFFKHVHNILYLQILDSQLISVAHEHDNFPKELSRVWFTMLNLSHKW